MGDRPFGPFTEFGPAGGSAEGLFEDFSWASGNQPLFLRQSVFDQIRSAESPATGVVVPEGRYRRPRRDPLVEIDTPPSAHIHPDLAIAPCSTCGFVTGRPTETRLEPERWDDTIPFQCIYENPGVTVINAALADFICDRQLSGVKLIELRVE